MEAYKEYKYIVFKLDDGKIVKYDLSTGETIGKLGKPVKNLNSQLRGCSIDTMIDSFEDENYKKFLRYIYKDLVDVWISNIGTFLNHVNKHSTFEQYFAAGIENVDKDLTYELKDVPKYLIKVYKKYDFQLDDNIISVAIKNPGLIQSIESIDCISLNFNDILKMISDDFRFKQLVNDYKYNPKTLIKYIDSIMTYEAVSIYNCLEHLRDYTRMMSKISPKYDKYPRNLLTSHEIARRNYNRFQVQFKEEEFQKCIKPVLEYTYKNYSIIYPKCVQDIKNEAVEQHHCVASHIDDVIAGECDILFLRKKEEVDKSLITLEVKHNKIRQAKGKFNRDVNDEESIVIEKYNSYLNKQETMECVA